MGAARTVKRFDTLGAGDWMTTPFTRTAEGFLTGRAIVTSIGVFTYQYADGTVLRELRLPEEVFASESLDTMKLKPVTNEHPDGLVTPDNQQELQVGSLGSDVTTTTQERDGSGLGRSGSDLAKHAKGAAFKGGKDFTRASGEEIKKYVDGLK